MEIDTEGLNSMKMLTHRIKQQQKLAGKNEIIPLKSNDIIDYDKSALLNAREGDSISNLIFPVSEFQYIQSDPDIDQQLLIKIFFKQPVDISSISFVAKSDIAGDSISGPKEIRMFNSASTNLMFEDVEDTKADAEFSISESNLESAEPFILKQTNFRNVNNLDIFVENNQNSTPSTFLNQLSIFGKLSERYHTTYR